jgi:hypothetical protein
MTRIPCPNDCHEGMISVYNVYETDADGLPVGHGEVCDACEGKGYVMSSSKVPEAN